jgi:uncharacterized membrane protein (DUF4010 family)
MCVRNLVLAAIFAPRSLAATLLPLLAMSLVTAVWIGLDLRRQGKFPAEPGSLSLDSPISIGKVLRFGVLFIVIQVCGTLLTKVFGSNGLLATSVFGGLVSSASTTAAAATMARHGSITASLAGSAAVLASIASALVNLPIVWRIIKDRRIVRRLTWEMSTIIAAGVAAVVADRIFGLSERLMSLAG